MPTQADFNIFGTVHSDKMQKPVTIASASVIAPKTALTIVTGTTQLVTITVPEGLEGAFHILWFLFPDAMGVFATSGNIAVGADPGVNILLPMAYNPITNKYYPGAIS